MLREGLPNQDHAIPYAHTMNTGTVMPSKSREVEQRVMSAATLVEPIAVHAGAPRSHHCRRAPYTPLIRMAWPALQWLPTVQLYLHNSLAARCRNEGC